MKNNFSFFCKMLFTGTVMVSCQGSTYQVKRLPNELLKEVVGFIPVEHWGSISLVNGASRQYITENTDYKERIEIRNKYHEKNPYKIFIPFPINMRIPMNMEIPKESIAYIKRYAIQHIVCERESPCIIELLELPFVKSFKLVKWLYHDNREGDIQESITLSFLNIDNNQLKNFLNKLVPEQREQVKHLCLNSNQLMDDIETNRFFNLGPIDLSNNQLKMLYGLVDFPKLELLLLSGNPFLTAESISNFHNARSHKGLPKVEIISFQKTGLCFHN